MGWVQPSWRQQLSVVFPAALSGITAAFVVAISRAIGETMVVAIAAGAGPRNFDSWGQVVSEPTKTPFYPFISAETMTGHIVRISGGDLSYNSVDYNSLFAHRSAPLLHHLNPQHHESSPCGTLP